MDHVRLVQGGRNPNNREEWVKEPATCMLRMGRMGGYLDRLHPTAGSSHLRCCSWAPVTFDCAFARDCAATANGLAAFLAAGCEVASLP